MPIIRRRALPILLALVLAVIALPITAGARPGRRPHPDVRFATFNVSLFRAERGELVADLRAGDEQARTVAEIVQLQRPDVLLVNEFDYDRRGQAVRLFGDRYLGVSQGGRAPIRYPYRTAFRSNTGVASGFDLNNDGVIGTSGRAYGDDAFGFGEFPGQYAFAIYSRYPIATEAIRTFQHFRWADMPGALLPDDPDTPAPADWYSP
ncbi:MAG: endonuclease/exonuclease/phosphatase family protein, partial [Euzebyaceae bacterium]|nr:endonuclease/exonuclease/phosphatase family protein [Euzebyaceae bacterium]